MPNWKKVAISGSDISQFNNDGTYIKMNGNTSNGLLTFEAADCAAVESNITYDGSIQRLVNNGQTNIYSGSYVSGQEPAINSSTTVKLTSKLSSSCALYTPTGSKNAILSVVGRHSSFGSGGECGATLSLTSQVGNSNKNATVQLTAIGKQNGCHDAIFTIGIKKDAGVGVTNHPINEMLRMDGRDRDITFSGSLFAQPSFISTSASLDNILVHDSVTGEIKKSSLTPPSSNSVTSVNGQTGAVTVDVPVDSVNGQTGAVTLSIPTDNNALTNGAGYCTTDQCVGTVCGEDINGTATSVANVNNIEFQCAAITTATNEATVKIHSSTQTSNKAQIPFPDTNDQLIGCSNIYICTSPTNGHQGALYNQGGPIIAMNENAGTLAVSSTVTGAVSAATWVGPASTPDDASNNAAPIYNIRPNTIDGYTTQNATSSLVVLTAQCTSNTTDNNNFNRIRMTHVDCNNLTFASTDLELISIGANGTYCETSAFSVNVRGNDQLYYRRLYIESSNSSMTPKNANIILSGSLHVDTSQMSTSASLASVLVYDNATGEIKKSSLTPSEGGASPGGSAGSIQYANAAVDAFDGESAFTYNETSNTLSVTNITASQLELTPGYHLKYDGSEVIMNEGLADKGYVIFGNSGISSVSVGDSVIDISGGAAVVVTATNICLGGKVTADSLSTTTATDCNSIVISSTGELLEGPVGGGGGSPAGSAGSIQYANATVESFDGESAFTYNETSNTMNVQNIITRCIEGDGNNLTITDGDNDALVYICSFGTEKTIFGVCDVEIGEASNTAASVINRAKVKIPDGTSSKPGIAFTNDPDMGLYRSGTSVILGLSDSSTVADYEFKTDGLKICDGALAVGNISPSTTTGRIDASNDIVAYSTSDCRLKKYVKPIKNALDKIDQIRGVEFDWKVTDDKIAKEVHSFEGHDVGVIAQEIEAVLPEVVTTRDSGYKAVRYEKIVPLLIQGIKELKDEVEILKSKI